MNSLMQVLALWWLACCWRTSTPAIRSYQAAYACLAAACIAWRRLSAASYVQWREAMACLLSLTSLGLGLGLVATCRLLDEPAAAAAAAGGGLSVEKAGPSDLLSLVLATAWHVVLLLFASGAVGMAALALSLRVRLR